MLPDHIRQRIESCSNDEQGVLNGHDAHVCLDIIDRLIADNTRFSSFIQATTHLAACVIEIASGGCETDAQLAAEALMAFNEEVPRGKSDRPEVGGK